MGRSCAAARGAASRGRLCSHHYPTDAASRCRGFSANAPGSPHATSAAPVPDGAADAVCDSGRRCRRAALIYRLSGDYNSTPAGMPIRQWRVTPAASVDPARHGYDWCLRHAVRRQYWTTIRRGFRGYARALHRPALAPRYACAPKLLARTARSIVGTTASRTLRNRPQQCPRLPASARRVNIDETNNQGEPIHLSRIERPSRPRIGTARPAGSAPRPPGASRRRREGSSTDITPICERHARRSRPMDIPRMRHGPSQDSGCPRVVDGDEREKCAAFTSWSTAGFPPTASSPDAEKTGTFVVDVG